MDTAQGELKVLKATGRRGQFHTEFFFLTFKFLLRLSVKSTKGSVRPQTFLHTNHII